MSDLIIFLIVQFIFDLPTFTLSITIIARQGQKKLSREKRSVGILIRFLVFKFMKKRSTRTSTRSHISMLVKKRSVGVLIRSLVFKLMKKRSTRTSTRSHISRFVKKRPVRVFFLIFVYERHQSHYASAFDSCCYFTLVFS